ncbi:MAG: hypothetical protein ACLRMJ_09165 [Alistipes finegoldii]
MVRRAAARNRTRRHHPSRGSGGRHLVRPLPGRIPGVQPERLGPYTTTFNPGYDPRLPLYRPWALFEA